MTSEPHGNKGPIKVEKQLFRVCKKLKETEVKASMFGQMVKRGVATADVRNFVNNQAKLKRADNHIHIPTVRQAMKVKFSDTIASANELRASKKEITEVLNNEFNYSKSKCRKLVRTCMERSEYHKERQESRLTKKFRHCQNKMDELRSTSFEPLPQEIRNIVDGVNIFSADLEPERCADPMICDRSIKLSKSELAFLRKGPRFMMRQSTNENEFCTELYKMVVKEKYEKLDSNGEEDVQTESPSLEEQVIIAESGLTYDKDSKQIDMGKFKATNYKFNKYVHLPGAESVGQESKHEIRKAEMLKIFKKTCLKAKKDNGERRRGSTKCRRAVKASDPNPVDRHGKHNSTECAQPVSGNSDNKSVLKRHGMPSIAEPNASTGQTTTDGGRAAVHKSHGMPSIAERDASVAQITDASRDSADPHKSHGMASIAELNASGGQITGASGASTDSHGGHGMHIITEGAGGVAVCQESHGMPSIAKPSDSSNSMDSLIQTANGEVIGWIEKLEEKSRIK